MKFKCPAPQDMMLTTVIKFKSVECKFGLVDLFFFSPPPPPFFFLLFSFFRYLRSCTAALKFLLLSLGRRVQLV